MRSPRRARSSRMAKIDLAARLELSRTATSEMPARWAALPLDLVHEIVDRLRRALDLDRHAFRRVDDPAGEAERLAPRDRRRAESRRPAPAPRTSMRRRPRGRADFGGRARRCVIGAQRLNLDAFEEDVLRPSVIVDVVGGRDVRAWRPRPACPRRPASKCSAKWSGDMWLSAPSQTETATTRSPSPPPPRCAMRRIRSFDQRRASCIVSLPLPDTSRSSSDAVAYRVDRGCRRSATAASPSRRSRPRCA